MMADDHASRQETYIASSDGSDIQAVVPPATTSTAPTPGTTASPVVPESRAELLARARAFLQSPQQDVAGKVKFLEDKGLNDAEIAALLRELPQQLPSVPPRTYPQPPPSHLPVLLLGIARLFSWLTGGSAVLIFIYYRFLLPRILRTAVSRKSLRSHHSTLLSRLLASLASLKESQAESLSVFPRPVPFKEPAAYASCNSIIEVLKFVGEKDPPLSKIPTVTLLRCGISDFAIGKEGDGRKPTTEEIFLFLEGRIPWLVTEDGLRYEQLLWDTLTSCPSFTADPPAHPSPAMDSRVDPTAHTRWFYTQPEPSAPSPLAQSLAELASVLPRATDAKSKALQHAMQALSDVTGYISSQIYMPYRPPLMGVGQSLGHAEELMRKEIRALKGLVLNRRTFLPPSVPRPEQGLTGSLGPSVLAE